ncbi:DUF493 domain-containing protein [Desulfoprunum benzoelyticum]|uniref:DUF493 domain-containing protein n=1 Tax=Desulfoprunum benzoelyticum TaxID=1506996 RepID=A0A840USB7_9BACT|nr:DUF493 domain-containing protein [Desulfoprunum benzoelyticum]MBB5347593.1 hypothetical protein [Desulfoprunum benzoelyticum]MBM9531089.1 DUF493 domain-containing protein [Desulfoprunum benzoelyticum]
MNLQDHRPHIVYPCIWSYKVIGEEADLLRQAILQACAPHPVKITVGRSSRGGRYHSLEATIEIGDEQTRLTIFERLKNHPAVKILL